MNLWLFDALANCNHHRSPGKVCCKMKGWWLILCLDWQNKPPPASLLVSISFQPPGQGLSSVWQDWAHLIKCSLLSEPLHKPHPVTPSPSTHCPCCGSSSLGSCWDQSRKALRGWWHGLEGGQWVRGLAQLGEALKRMWRNWLTWLVVAARVTVRKVCSHVQRQERGVVQGPVGDGREGWLPGPLKMMLKMRHTVQTALPTTYVVVRKLCARERKVKTHDTVSFFVAHGWLFCWLKRVKSGI